MLEIFASICLRIRMTPRGDMMSDRPQKKPQLKLPTRLHHTPAHWNKRQPPPHSAHATLLTLLTSLRLNSRFANHHTSFFNLRSDERRNLIQRQSERLFSSITEGIVEISAIHSFSLATISFGLPFGEATAIQPLKAGKNINATARNIAR
ncbi:MAG TPA: hypothetical protein VNQ99_10305 [Xanthobacteraceae bacterium]|nr:hypothetical protein [Xanthobacteraceae bacterium]